MNKPTLLKPTLNIVKIKGSLEKIKLSPLKKIARSTQKSPSLRPGRSMLKVKSLRPSSQL